jgi:hypothetical protein
VSARPGKTRRFPGGNSSPTVCMQWIPPQPRPGGGASYRSSPLLVRLSSPEPMQSPLVSGASSSGLVRSFGRSESRQSDPAFLPFRQLVRLRGEPQAAFGKRLSAPGEHLPGDSSKSSSGLRGAGRQSSTRIPNVKGAWSTMKRPQRSLSRRDGESATITLIQRAA